MIDDDVTLGVGARVYQPSNLYGCAIGQQTLIGPFVEVQRGAVIGRECHICSHAFIAGGARLGDRVFVGHGVMTVNDLYPVIGERTALWTLLVEDDVSIGTGAVLLPVRIGRGAVIGAGALVVKDVPSLAVVVGNPGRVLRQFATLEERQEWIRRRNE